eukprot:g2358.t1
MQGRGLCHEVYALASDIAIASDADNATADFLVEYEEDRNRQCSDGYAGLLCQNCDMDGGYVKQWQKCKKCRESETQRAKIMLILAGVLVPSTAAAIFAKYPERCMRTLQERNMPFKIFVGFVQVVSTIPENFRLVFPSIVIDFFEFVKYLNVFDVFSFAAQFRCVLSYNYYFFLFMKNVSPLLLLACLGVVMLLPLSHVTKSLLLNAALLFSLTVYTSMYTSLFQYFDCRGYEDGEMYLVIELLDLLLSVAASIKCTDDAYTNRLWVIILLCMIVTVGFPLAYSYLLFKQDEQINPRVLGKFLKLGTDMAQANIRLQQASNRDSSQRTKTLWIKDKHLPQQAEAVLQQWSMQLATILRMKHGDDQLRSTNSVACAALIERAYRVSMARFGPAAANSWLQECHRGTTKEIESTKFLWAPYLPRFYWLELLEILRKFMLTGLPSLIRLICGEGTGIDVGVGVMASAGFSVYYSSISPYRSVFDLISMRPTQYLIVIIIACGVATEYGSDHHLTDVAVTVVIIGRADRLVKKTRLRWFRSQRDRAVALLRKSIDDSDSAKAFPVLCDAIDELFSDPTTSDLDLQRMRDTVKLLADNEQKRNVASDFKEQKCEALRSLCEALAVEFAHLPGRERALLPRPGGDN